MLKRLTTIAIVTVFFSACSQSPFRKNSVTEETPQIVYEQNTKENNMDPINIKSNDYRYDSFSNGETLSFVKNKKKGLPAMGWNSWNAFGSANTEELTKIMADKFIELGLDKLGYKYIILDDGCYKPERIDGKLSNEPVKFPNGFKNLSDYIHSKNLKFGMYNDIGTNLCAGAAVGTCGHEDVDAASYMDWGVDFLKVDNCYYLWDNATFSDATNARFVYAPNIRSIKIKGKNLSEDLILNAVKTGILYGNGIKKEGNCVTNIGTFDGTGPDQTPIGQMSGELIFEINVPSSGEYNLFVEYATSQEPGQGEWLQIAIKGQDDLILDGFLPATENKNSFIFSAPISIKLEEGKNILRLMNHRRQENTLSSYAKLLEEINKINPENDLVFSTCEWGKTQPQNWAYKVANSWRILNDITFAVGAPGNPGKGNWVDGYTPSITSQYNKAVIMDEYAGLNKGWNDPDMLVIGMDGLTPEMNRTHFTMWCMMNSPLMLGMDLRRVQKDDWMFNIITNKKLIDLNQDILGVQAKRIKAVYKRENNLVKIENPSTAYTRNNDRLDILAKPLYDGSIAISFINLSQTETYNDIFITMKEIMDAIGYKMPVRPDYVNAPKLVFENLWTGEKAEILWTKENAATGIRISSGTIKPCDNLTIRISTTEPMERRHVAASIHNYLLNTLHEKDEENWDAAKELKDLYDCHSCVMHIAQVYVKGIMSASEENEELFGVRQIVKDSELLQIVNRVLSRT